ncbi:MAG: DoxX family protein [Anaerolineae bacterium]|nr:DoxX family protein [Anaerolineae bacterium]
MTQHITTQELPRFDEQSRPQFTAQLTQLDQRLVRWLAKNSLTLLRVSVGIIFLWFGALKLVPGLSPAEPLIRSAITFLPMDFFLPFLAVWEMAIGLGFIIGKFQRAIILLLLMQMGGAMSPILLSPDRIWNVFPFALTLEGQYVVKDIILISAGLVIGATVRGGHLTAE